jgi:hypothetical protein
MKIGKQLTCMTIDCHEKGKNKSKHFLIVGKKLKFNNKKDF